MKLTSARSSPADPDGCQKPVDHHRDTETQRTHRERQGEKHKERNTRREKQGEEERQERGNGADPNRLMEWSIGCPSIAASLRRTPPRLVVSLPVFPSLSFSPCLSLLAFLCESSVSLCLCGGSIRLG